VSWTEAEAFCQKLSAKEKVTYRLPTEAEWEYACRAGTETEYSFGDSEVELAQYVWHGRNSGRRTHPVGQKKPNPWELFDMHGNVWEWCADWYGSYASSAVTDPAGPTSGSSCVTRGGGCSGSAIFLRSAARFKRGPSNFARSLGFRVARSLR